MKLDNWILSKIKPWLHSYQIIYACRGKWSTSFFEKEEVQIVPLGEWSNNNITQWPPNLIPDCSLVHTLLQFLIRGADCPPWKVIKQQHYKVTAKKKLIPDVFFPTCPSREVILALSSTICPRIWDFSVFSLSIVLASFSIWVFKAVICKRKLIDLA